MKKYILVILVLALAVLGFFVWDQYRSIQSAKVVPIHHHGPFTAADAAYIQPWMTFEYIDFSYNLPPTYLQTRLNIRDPRYPRISIRQYALDSDFDFTAITKDVIGLVQSYLAGQSVSAVSTTSSSTVTQQ